MEQIKYNLFSLKCVNWNRQHYINCTLEVQTDIHSVHSQVEL